MGKKSRNKKQKKAKKQRKYKRSQEDAYTFNVPGAGTFLSNVPPEEMSRETIAVLKQYYQEKNNDQEEEEFISPVALSTPNYTITYEPIELYSSKINKQAEKTYHLVHDEPELAIPKLHHLVKKYPNVPMFKNHLTMAYQQIEDEKNVKFWSQENYRLHPDYLFARLNLASLHLKNKELQKVEEILEGKFDLHLLYPERNVFHISEAIAFFGLMGRFYCFKGETVQAKRCYKILKQLDPDHAHRWFLKKQLYPFATWLSFSFAMVKDCLLFILSLPILFLLTSWDLIAKFFEKK